MNMGRMPYIAAAALALAAAGAHAQGSAVRVIGIALGSGVPSAHGAPASSVADHVADDDFHVPNYLPGHPTASTLWPRVVHVPCRRHADRDELLCAGYGVSPLRGEYIYLRPVVEAEPPPPPQQPPQQPPQPASPPPAPPVQKKPLG